MLYKVVQDKEVQIGDQHYRSGEIVDLTPQQAEQLASSVVRYYGTTGFTIDDGANSVNYRIPRGSDFYRTIGLGIKTLAITQWTLQNPLVIKTEVDHGLATGSKVWIHGFRQTQLNQDVLISDIYAVTRITADTFSIPKDGTQSAAPQEGYVDFLEDISQSVFDGQLYDLNNNLIQGLTVTQNNDRSEITIQLPYSSNLTLDQYSFKIFETQNTARYVILEGSVIYE